MTSLPPVAETPYNKQKLGYFGELGSGAHARIRFLQSAVSKDELDNITLIENIPGSERWDIRDLFQRDVDMKRVEQSILPYLMDPAKVKFFNPLTLVLLPVDPAGGIVDANVPYVEPSPVTKDGHNYTRYERSGFYCFDAHNAVPAYSELRWNDNKIKLVAIDGQHRLSALKFWKASPGPKDLDNWQIPVVILGVFRADNVARHKPANLLEIVRKTFVYINSRAEEVNESRRILLDDEEIEAVCTQELVQASHTNDCLEEASRDPRRLPLLFFDWRGQVRWRKDEQTGVEIVAPGSALSIEEIYDWLKLYVLGDAPRIALELDDLDPPLSSTFQERGVLSHEDTARIRTQFLKVVYPGMSHLLENFSPFKHYVEKIRQYEKKQRQESEAAALVFQKLRFGSHPEVLGRMKELVDTAFAAVVQQLERMRADCFDELVERDIGMRAVMFAFASLKGMRDTFARRTGSWKDHAEWFVPKLNVVYSGGWFKAYSDLNKRSRTMLTHICFDPAGTIINYKLGDVAKGFGPLLALLVVQQGLTGFTDEQKDPLWEMYGEALDATLRRGFRKEQRAKLKESFTGTLPEFVAEVNKRADKNVADRLKQIHSDVFGK